LSENTSVVTRFRYERFFDDLTFEDATDTADGNYIANKSTCHLAAEGMR